MKIRDGEIIVSTPFNYDPVQLDVFIRRRIEKKALHLENRYDKYVLDLENSWLWIFGKKVLVDYLEEPGRSKMHIVINDSHDVGKLQFLEEVQFFIRITAPMQTKHQKIIQYFYKQFDKKYYNLYLNEIHTIAANYGVKVKKFVFKKLRGTWGICKSNSNEIVMAKKLIHYPFSIQHYVMVHEVAHILEPNHSAQFWAIVMQQCPNYKELRRKLRW